MINTSYHVYQTDPKWKKIYLENMSAMFLPTENITVSIDEIFYVKRGYFD